MLQVVGWGREDAYSLCSLRLPPTSVVRYLANDMEEDLEEAKCVIFPWALGKDWHHQVADFLRQRDKLWARMGFRAAVSCQCCEEVRPCWHSGVGERGWTPPPPPFTIHSVHARSWPGSRPTGPGLGKDALTMAGLRGAARRPRFPSPGALASRHLTVPSVACPLSVATTATNPAPCLSYPSARLQTLSGIALLPMLVSQWLKTLGVEASSWSCLPSCIWSQAPTPSTVSWGRELEDGLGSLGGRCKS